MPTYDYKCPKCSVKFEKFHGINETSKIACPECGTESAKQIGGGAGIMFKGTGFYVTDYKSVTAGQGPTGTEKAAPKACAGGGACGCA